MCGHDHTAQWSWEDSPADCRGTRGHAGKPHVAKNGGLLPANGQQETAALASVTCKELNSAKKHVCLAKGPSPVKLRKRWQPRSMPGQQPTETVPKSTCSLGPLNARHCHAFVTMLVQPAGCGLLIWVPRLSRLPRGRCAGAGLGEGDHGERPHGGGGGAAQRAHSVLDGSPDQRGQSQ